MAKEKQYFVDLSDTRMNQLTTAQDLLHQEKILNKEYSESLRNTQAAL